MNRVEGSLNSHTFLRDSSRGETIYRIFVSQCRMDRKRRQSGRCVSYLVSSLQGVSHISAPICIEKKM